MEFKKLRLIMAGVCLFAGAFFAFPSAGSCADATTAEKPLYADLDGLVVDEAGNPVAGANVNLLYETTVTDGQGRFRFPKIPTIHTSGISMQVTNDAGVVIGCTNFDIPVKFYPIAATMGNKVGVVIVEPGAETSVKIAVKAVTIDQVNEYCSGCHIKNPCVETTTFGTVVKKDDKKLRGLVVKESELKSVREKFLKLGLAKESYRTIRHQDTHPDAIEMNSEVNNSRNVKGVFRMPDKLTMRIIYEGDKEKRYVVCDTCHSRHSTTQQRQFVVLPFDEDSQLCYQCHN
ncbi:hypothetical protein FDZ71_03980 [bacterium]|nr:MAG: hypothetical protein FDZ71_03980 [bacterium]